MKYVRFYTLGCKVNLYETQAMQGLFENSGYTCTENDDADVFVINTCTVTAVGDKKSRQMISRAKKKNPNAVVAVVGCYAQVSPDDVRKMPDVDIILGTTDRARVVDYVEQFKGFRIDAVKDRIEAEYEDMVSDVQSRTRAMLKVQDGCNNFCAYCIIPYARGPIRSREIASAVAEVKSLALKGFTEVVLVGIHLSSYGKEKTFTLLDLLREISTVDGIRRIRLGSLEPMIVTDAFVREIADMPKVCRAFHVSMQSGCDATLKRMKRLYTSAQYLQALSRLRSAMPDCGVTTDVMVGFPGETDEEFLESCQTVIAARFADLHVFSYSKRKGTPAAQMDNQVPADVKAERSRRMIAIGEGLKAEYCGALVGTQQEVLFEEEKDGCSEGYTSEYVRVRVKETGLEGQYRYVQILSYDGGCLTGALIGGDYAD